MIKERITKSITVFYLIVIYILINSYIFPIKQNRVILNDINFLFTALLSINLCNLMYIYLQQIIRWTHKAIYVWNNSFKYSNDEYTKLC